MSALPPKADIAGRQLDVRFGGYYGYGSYYGGYNPGYYGGYYRRY